MVNNFTYIGSDRSNDKRMIVMSNQSKAAIIISIIAIVINIFTVMMWLKGQ